MKWFRHNSDSYSNLKMQELIAEYGVNGYGVFWVACELVAQQGEKYRINNGKNWKKAISNVTKVEQRELDGMFVLMGKLNMIDEKELSKNCLFIPKMEEYSDDYTNRVRRVSEQSPNKVRTKSEQSTKKSAYITLHNSTLHNNIRVATPNVAEKIETHHKEIVEVIDAFKGINAEYKTWYGNKTQRAAILRLLEVKGKDIVLGVVALLQKTNVTPFMPVITTPHKLAMKWSDLEAMLKKKKIEVISKGRGLA